MSGWKVIGREETHVIPLDDLRPHTAEEGCWCHPTDDAGVWVHHSLDRREFIEQGQKPA